MHNELANVTVVASDLGFTEGPVLLPDGALVSVSITTGTVSRTANGTTNVVAELGPGSNGAAVDSAGNIYVAHNGGRWAHLGPTWLPERAGGVYKLSPSGTVIWFSSDPISPNDLCFGSDGALYVTDPTRAARGDDGRLWRLDPETGSAELLRSVSWFPNGLAFGPDGALYIASTMEQRIYVVADITDHASPLITAIQLEEGHPDGMAFDVDGNLVIGAISLRDGVPGTLQSWTTDGALLDTVVPGPEGKYTNLALSPAQAEIFIADSDGGSLLRAPWPVSGLPLHTPHSL